MAGFHGCIPEDNQVYTNTKSAEEGLKEVRDMLKESGNKLRGSIKGHYFEVVKKTDALCDYIDIESCNEEECLKEIEE